MTTANTFTEVSYDVYEFQLNVWAAYGFDIRRGQVDVPAKKVDIGGISVDNKTNQVDAGQTGRGEL